VNAIPTLGDDLFGCDMIKEYFNSLAESLDADSRSSSFGGHRPDIGSNREALLIALGQKSYAFARFDKFPARMDQIQSGFGHSTTRSRKDCDRSRGSTKVTEHLRLRGNSPRRLLGGRAVRLSPSAEPSVWPMHTARDWRYNLSTAKGQAAHANIGQLRTRSANPSAAPDDNRASRDCRAVSFQGAREAHHARRHSNRPLAGDVAPDQSCSDRVVAPMTIVTVASGGLAQNRRWQ
jgi:hypothetical protein